MKIVHIAPNAPYNEGWGYQENLLPKYQVRNGHDVTLIITNTMHQNGKVVPTQESDSVLPDRVRVIRKAYKQFPWSRVRNLLAYIPVYELLKDIRPDLIFYHGLLSTTILDVVRYKIKFPECHVVQDNHLDLNIGFKVDSFRQKIIRTYYRGLNAISVRYVDKVYGVTPWRKTYAEEYFKIPSYKTDVLIMGADDEQLCLTQRESLRKKIREQYHVGEHDFLIVTGGKIDKKKKIDLLMQACSQMDVKLLVFGNVLPDVQEDFNKILEKSPNITYAGWLPSERVYEYFYAADLVVFPGQHSVLWEQACASKVPCVFERWEGMDHVNNGGNADFVMPVTVDNLKDKINELIFTPQYREMKRNAESSKTDIYLYSEIAKKSVEVLEIDLNNQI